MADAITRLAGKNAVSQKLKVALAFDIRNIYEWNTAVLFQLWRIVKPGNSSIWVQYWFNHVLLKNKGFWTAKIPYKTSWVARKILSYRPQALKFIQYHIGPNSAFKFWLDPWLRNRPLLWDYNEQDISNADSNSLALNSDIMLDRTWNLPLSTHLHIMQASCG